MIIYYAGVTYKSQEPEKVLDEAGVLLSYYDFHKGGTRAQQRLDDYREHRRSMKPKKKRKKNKNGKPSRKS